MCRRTCGPAKFQTQIQLFPPSSSDNPPELHIPAATAHFHLDCVVIHTFKTGALSSAVIVRKTPQTIKSAAFHRFHPAPPADIPYPCLQGFTKLPVHGHPDLTAGSGLPPPTFSPASASLRLSSMDSPAVAATYRLFLGEQIISCPKAPKNSQRYCRAISRTKIHSRNTTQPLIIQGRNQSDTASPMYSREINCSPAPASQIENQLSQSDIIAGPHKVQSHPPGDISPGQWTRRSP